MLADAQTKFKNLVWPHEENPKEHLLLDPIPQEEMNQIMLKPMMSASPAYWLVVAILAAIVAVCIFGMWAYQIRWGMGVDGIRRPVGWGVFIATFVFWIGISHSGTFVSAILRVFNAEFRRPITRAAELMVTISLACGGLFPVIHLGRAWVVYFMVPMPNQRQLWPNFQSPLVWDLLAITTYLISSTIYVYLPMIPDLAMARDHTTGWRHTLVQDHVAGVARHGIRISLSAQGPQHHGLCDHPDHVLGAYHRVVGLCHDAADRLAQLDLRALLRHRRDLLRRLCRHHPLAGGAAHHAPGILPAPEHFDALAKLVLIFSMAWTYFFFNDFLVEWYGGEAAGHDLLSLQMHGALAPFWWTMLILNILIPLGTLWSKRVRSSPIALFLITIGINIGMYLERVIIIPGFLQRNRMPFNWGEYTPRLPEISIAIGTLALFILLYMLASKVIPLIPVWEVLEGQLSHSRRRIGKTVVTSVAELE